MYKIRINCDGLKRNSRKLKDTDVEDIVRELNMPTYQYIQSVHIVRKIFPGTVTKRFYTCRFLEFTCKCMVTLKTLRKFIKKLQTTAGVQGNNTKVDFIELLTNMKVYCVQFNNCENIAVESTNQRYKNRSKYNTQVIYKRS